MIQNNDVPSTKPTGTSANCCSCGSDSPSTHPPSDPKIERAARLLQQQSGPVNPDPNGRESEQSDDHGRKIAVARRYVKGAGYDSHFLVGAGDTSSSSRPASQTHSVAMSFSIGDMDLPYYPARRDRPPAGTISLDRVVEKIRSSEQRLVVSTIREMLRACEELVCPECRRDFRPRLMALQSAMPCVGLDTVSLGRNTALIPVSVSDLENPEHFRDLLFHDDPRIVLSMVSVQGDGVSLIYRANSTPGARRNAALQIAEELKGRYGVTVSRPSGFPARIPLGWDPDAKFRPDAEVVKIFSRSQESKIPDAAGKMNPNQKEGF